MPEQPMSPPPDPTATEAQRAVLLALAERLESAEDVETSPYRIVLEADVLAAAKALRALAAQQETARLCRCVTRHAPNCPQSVIGG